MKRPNLVPWSRRNEMQNLQPRASTVRDPGPAAAGSSWPAGAAAGRGRSAPGRGGFPADRGGIRGRPGCPGAVPEVPAGTGTGGGREGKGTDSAWPRRSRARRCCWARTPWPPRCRQFEKKRAEYFEFREGIDQRAEAEYKAKITPILDQIKTIVERIGKEKDYGLIVDSAALAVLYIDSDYDLTNDVLAALARGDD